jgi:hypothetical protein
MMSDKLPSVLTPKYPDSAISMVRALKQIKDLLEQIEPSSDSEEDRLNASIDDVKVMLESIEP